MQSAAPRVLDNPPGEGAAKPRILVVDDEPSMRDMLRIVLRVDLLLSDIRRADLSGVDVLRTARQMNRDIIAFMMTAYASTETAVEAMRLGAVDYFTKPFSMDELRLKIRQHLEAKRLKQENLLLKRALNSRHEFSSILGRSDAMVIRTRKRLEEFGLARSTFRSRQRRGWDIVSALSTPTARALNMGTEIEPGEVVQGEELL